MTLLHDYIANQISERLKDRRIVVMYDPRNELSDFFEEASTPRGNSPLRDAKFGPRNAKLFLFQGSFLQVRATVEPITGGEEVEDLVIYLGGTARDEKTSLLLELEKAGVHYAQPPLRQMARNVLKKRFTDVAIDEMLKGDGLTYADLALMAEDSGTGENASLLKGIFGDSDTRTTIATWILDDNRDREVEQKGATGELRRALYSRVGLDVPEGTSIAKLRSHAARFILGNEFRLGLTAAEPTCLSTLATATSRDQEAAIRHIAGKLRDPMKAAAYEQLADRVQAELGLDEAAVSGDALGSVDTFRFEERAALSACFDLIANDKSKDAQAIVSARGHSFWVDRQVTRKVVWEACRLMIEMGVIAEVVMATISKANGKPQQWVDRYVDAGPEGWFRLDQAQRQLETLLAVIEDEEVSEAAVARCRAKYDEVARRLAEGFTKVFEKADWSIPETLPQHRFWAEIVTNLPKPLAVIVVDAMRYEMGVELAERLRRSAEVKLQPALAALPSITPIGMAALLPGAAASFSIADKNGRFGAAIGDAFLPDLSARLKFLHAQVPGVVDLTLDEVLTWKAPTQKKVAGAQIVFVRSSEIDAAGENTENRYARRIMEGTVGDVARCLNKLASAGIENAVVTADHGHLFFASEREEAMRISNPGGSEVDFHRRCWIGRGGSTPPGTARISGPKLGYVTDLDIVVPTSVSVFKTGGDLAYHHGGASLQELVIPIITARMKAAVGGVEKKAVTVKFAAEAVTNRIFLVEISLGGPIMFAEPRRVRPLAVVGSRQVASAKMTTTGPIENGEIRLVANEPITVALVLSDDTTQTLKIQILDADTDAVLYESPKDIPVRLAM